MPTLIFVYNAEFHIKDLAEDIIAKLFPQKKGKCNLCDITYSLAWKKSAWSSFLKTLPVNTVFTYKTPFRKTYPTAPTPAFGFPTVYVQTENGVLTEGITAKELNNMTSLDELLSAVKTLIERL